MRWLLTLWAASVLIVDAVHATAQAPVGGTVVLADSLKTSSSGKVTGGKFVDDGGWTAVGPDDRIVWELPDYMGDGTLELKIRNFDPPRQAVARKTGYAPPPKTASASKGVSLDRERGWHFPPPGQGLDVQDRRPPAAVGIDPALLDRLQGTADRWALWRHGRLVHVAGDFNKTVHVASLRKTWHAMTVGAALQQGKIPSLDQKISVWQSDLKGLHADATWRHVITQSSGFDYPYADKPAYRPGEMWTYSDKNPLRLTDALAKVYGRSGYEDDYASVLRAAYFDAIGMQGWAAKPRYDGTVLDLDLEDMGRLGLLVLARGRWAGRQLVAQSFVEALETKQTRGMLVNYDGPDDGKIAMSYPEAPYGYMTWVNTDRDVYPRADKGWAWGSGAGGHGVFWNHRFGIVFAAHGRDRDVPFPEIIEASITGPDPLVAQK